MVYPNFGDKSKEKAIITPSKFIAYQKSLNKLKFTCPSRIILTYSKKLLTHVEQTYSHTVADFSGKLLLLDDFDLGVIGHIGIGGPFTSTIVEELGGLGANEFIIIGTAGGIAKDQDIGDVTIVDRAIRDEGVSHHYLSPSKYVESSAKLLNEISNHFDLHGSPYCVGSTWTIDAPYRETEAEVLQYQADGVRTVEMEAATVFSIAKHRGYHALAILVVSDDLSDLEWNPQFHSDNVRKSLKDVVNIVIKGND